MINDKGNYMKTQVRLASVAVLIGCTAIAGSAQSVISAHSGTLHYFDGSVSIDGQSVQSKVGKFSEIKENSVLRTGQGRAEVLLTPGVFLRVGENTEIKMLDNRLLSTRVEILSGTAMLESDDPEVSVKNPAVTLIYKDYEIQPVKNAVLEIASVHGQLKVFKGQASVSAGASHIVVKEGKLMPFSAALLTEKFDEKQADDLYLWARDRSAYLSAANMSSARSLASSGYPLNGLGGGFMGLGYNSSFSGGWYYNPYLSMYTYMPYGGVAWSPFGYGYFSPYTIYSYYSPGNYYWYGGGSRGSSSGVPLSTIGTSSLASQQVARTGAGTATHPTLSSPVRTAGGFSGTNAAASGGFRDGFSGGSGTRGGFNPGFNSGVTNSAPVSAPSSNSGGFAAAGARGGGGSVGGGGVGGGSRGK